MSGTLSNQAKVALIPTSAKPQRFSLTLQNVTYNFTLVYRDADQGGWVLDIADVNNQPLLCGVPLVIGRDLLSQYAYLNFGGALVVSSIGGQDDSQVPMYSELGRTAQLYFVSRT